MRYTVATNTGALLHYNNLSEALDIIEFAEIAGYKATLLVNF